MEAHQEVSLNLLQRWEQLQSEEAGILIRNAAERFGVSELELFDASGNTMIQVFGVRQQVNFDSNAWNTFLDESPDA